MGYKKRLAYFSILIFFSIGCIYFLVSIFTVNVEKKYNTHTVSRGEILRKVIATGEISAAQMVTVGSQASGKIENVYIKVGDTVKKGQRIVDIDATTQNNALKTNIAQLKTYKAQLKSKEVSLKNSKAKYNRELKLYTKDSTSKENVENAEIELEKIVAELEECKSLVVQGEISVQTAEANLSYTQISAPIDGIVISIPVEAGQTVNAAQLTPTIAQIADTSKMLIKIQIAESDITKVHEGHSVTFNILSDPNEKYITTIHTIDPGSTSLSLQKDKNIIESAQNAVTFFAKSYINNDEKYFKIGMTAQCYIENDKKTDVIIVPIQYIENTLEKNYVYTIKNGMIDKQHVEIGLSDEINTEIKHGLKEGEEIVTIKYLDEGKNFE